MLQGQDGVKFLREHEEVAILGVGDPVLLGGLEDGIEPRFAWWTASLWLRGWRGDVEILWERYHRLPDAYGTEHLPHQEIFIKMFEKLVWVVRGWYAGV